MLICFFKYFKFAYRIALKQNLEFTKSMLSPFRNYVLQMLLGKPFTDYCTFCFAEKEGFIQCTSCLMSFCKRCEEKLKSGFVSKCIMIWMKRFYKFQKLVHYIEPYSYPYKFTRFFPKEILGILNAKYNKIKRFTGKSFINSNRAHNSLLYLTWNWLGTLIFDIFLITFLISSHIC